MTEIQYESIRPSLKTGDIVLFSGKSKVSFMIKLATNSIWSHVGMALRLPQSEAVFLWESTTLSNLKDITTGKAKRGVQLVLLSERLRAYDGKVAIRPLLKGVDEPGYYDLMEFREEVRGRDYERDKMELVKSAYDGPFGANEEDLSSLFCSELVAEAYQRLGLLQVPPKGLPSNEYTPRDFAKDMKLSGNALGDEFLVSRIV